MYLHSGWIEGPHIHIYTYIYTYIERDILSHIYPCIHIFIKLCLSLMYLHSGWIEGPHIHIYIYICKDIYVYIHVYIYVYTYRERDKLSHIYPCM
jgi:hypothetical protein